MWCNGSNETPEQRYARLLSARVKKANILNSRIELFYNDIMKSTIFKDSEKAKILQEFKFIKTS
jgi:hypothetical protein